MPRRQLDADIRQSRPDLRRPPDDSRKTTSLHRTRSREREHRDRGDASDSAAWRIHQRQERD
jgi:hypothetical protein